MKKTPKHINTSRLIAFLLLFGTSLISQSNNAKLPSADVIIAKHIEAIGGKERLSNLAQMNIEGTMSILVYGMTGSINVKTEAPNKMITTVDLGQFGISRSGFDGEIAWSMNTMSGNQILSGEALKAMKEKSNFYGNTVDLGKDALKKETVEITKIDEKDYYRVMLVNKAGEESYLFFSLETGLLNIIDRVELGPTGKVPTRIILSDYVEHEGVKISRKMLTKQNGVETTIEFSSVSFSIESKNAFELPAEIKALVKK